MSSLKKTNDEDNSIEMRSFLSSSNKPTETPHFKPKVSFSKIVITFVMISWYLLNLFIFSNFLLGTLAPFPLQKISNSDPHGWINVMQNTINALESVKKGATGDTAPMLPLQWPHGKTTYYFYFSSLCRETEESEKICNQENLPFVAFLNDLGSLMAQALDVDDVEGFVETWTDGFKNLLVEALTEVEREKLHEQIFGEKGELLDSLSVDVIKGLKFHLGVEFPPGWSFRLFLFTVSFALDAWIVIAAAQGWRLGDKTPYLDIPIFGSCILHFVRLLSWFLTTFVLFPALVWEGSLYEGLENSSFLHALVSMVDAFQITYPLVWYFFLLAVTRDQ